VKRKLQTRGELSEALSLDDSHGVLDGADRVGVVVRKLTFDRWSSAYFRRTAAWASEMRYLRSLAASLNIDNKEDVLQNEKDVLQHFTASLQIFRLQIQKVAKHRYQAFSTSKYKYVKRSMCIFLFLFRWNTGLLVLELKKKRFTRHRKARGR